MKQPRLLVVTGLLLGFSAAMSASAIHTASSNYGSVSNTDACYSLGTLSGVTVSPEAFQFSEGSDCVFDVEIASGSDFTLDFQGTADFLTSLTNMSGTYYGNGFFTCPGAGNQCGPDPTAGGYNVSVDAGSDNISLTVNGSGDGLVFFVVEPETPGAIDNIVTLTGGPIASTPEPRLWPVLGLAIVGLLLLRKRSIKAS
jgi:hypothetical protein